MRHPPASDLGMHMTNTPGVWSTWPVHVAAAFALLLSAATAQAIEGRKMSTNERPAPRSAADGQSQTPGTAADRPLEGTYWRAIELAGKPLPEVNPKREAYLQFEDGRVSGSDGCNRLMGSYLRSGDRITFSQVAGTLMACADATGLEGAFRDALQKTARMTIAGDRLALLDAAGALLVRFAARDESSPSARAELAGTSWQLVRFQGGDDTTLTPDDRAKYTIEFAADGRLAARIDCNRGRGTWTSNGPNEIRFGPLALTRAMCPPGSLHDQIVKQWDHIRTYVIRDGHLFLALMADGGIFEFEPIEKGRL